MHEFVEDFYEDQVFRKLTLENEDVAAVTFYDCSFTNCNFAESTFRSCTFRGCTFENCDLSLTKVDDSKFINTVFEHSKIIGVNWVNASWGKNDLHQLLKSIDFIDCVLNYSIFMGLTLEKMLVKKCIARGVDFSEANLKRADCSFSDFTDSQFRHTDLTETDFRGATNYFIKPDLNTLKKTKFSLPEAMSLLYNLDIEIGDPISGANEEN